MGGDRSATSLAQPPGPLIQALLERFPATVLVHDTVFLGALPLSLRPPSADRPTTICLGVLPPCC
ncbi:hypothetical protein [Nonomuraea deserti]|nr:hypothetical protein [Nonomuraea deserti]